MKLPNNPVAIKWYKSLDINQKINIKDSTILFLGMSFSELQLLFNLREIITIMYDKLLLEGMIT